MRFGFPKKEQQIKLRLLQTNF